MPFKLQICNKYYKLINISNVWIFLNCVRTLIPVTPKLLLRKKKKKEEAKERFFSEQVLLTPEQFTRKWKKYKSQSFISF